MTFNLQHLEPIDYLIIGHVTQDVTPEGLRLGGTAAFSALTAHALGLRVGIVTACSPETDLSILDGISIIRHASDPVSYTHLTLPTINPV